MRTPEVSSCGYAGVLGVLVVEGCPARGAPVVHGSSPREERSRLGDTALGGPAGPMRLAVRLHKLPQLSMFDGARCLPTLGTRETFVCLLDSAWTPTQTSPVGHRSPSATRMLPVKEAARRVSVLHHDSVRSAIHWVTATDMEDQTPWAQEVHQAVGYRSPSISRADPGLGDRSPKVHT